MGIKKYFMILMSLLLLGSGNVLFSQTPTNWVEISNAFYAESVQAVVLQNNELYVASMFGSSIEIKRKDSWVGSYTTITSDATNTIGAQEYKLINYYEAPAIVVKDLNNALRLFVYDGVSFVAVGGFLLNPDFGSGLSVSTDPATGNLYVSITSYGGSQGANIYLFNGVSWTNLVSEFNPLGGYNVYSPQIHVDGNMVYLGFIIDDIIGELYVYKAQKDVLSNANLVQHSISGLLTEVTDFKMKGEPNEFPYIISTDGYTTLELNISRLTTTGSEDLASINTSTYGAEFDFTVFNNELKIVYNFEVSIESYELRTKKWTLANGFEELTDDPYIMTEQTWDYSIISPPNGARTIVTNVANTAGYNYGKVSLTNRLPIIFEVQQNPICEGAGNQNVSLFQTLILKDFDFDKIQLNAVESTDYGVIEASVNLAIVPLGEYNPYTNTQEFDVIATNIGVAGSTTLTLFVSDGIETVELTTQFTVSPASTSNVTLTEIEACSNGDVINMNEAVGGIYNGQFFYDGQVVPDGMFNPSTYTGISTDQIKFVHPHASSGCLMENFIQPIIYSPSELEVTITPTSCGDNTGTAQLVIPNPIEPNTIYWSNGKSDIMTIENLATGQYFVNVTNGYGCLSVAPVNIASVEAVVVDNIVNATCFGASNGSISLNISGPDAPYTVLWNTGQSIPNLTNMPAGIYDVVITGNSGCQFSKTYTINQPPKIKLNSVSFIEPDCGTNNGQINPIVAGGTGALSFEWNSGQTTQSVINVAPGFYTLTASDQASCSQTFEFTLSNLNATGFTATVNQPTCGMSDGKVRVYPSNPWMVQSISWSNGVNGVNNPNIPVGEYRCELLDWSGCQTFRKWDLKGKQPQLNEICIVTVDSATTTNLVVWEKTQTSGIDYYNIYRESSIAGSFIKIDTVSSQNLSVFNDVVASPMNRSWRYKISAVDFCGIEGPTSPIHKTIHLVKTKINQTDYQVTWDKYEGVIDGDLGFYRYTTDLGWVLVGVYPITANSITDTPDSEDGLDYMVEIIPSEPCTATRAQDYNSSRSNKANSIFNPGEGTGDSHNSINENDENLPLITIYPNPTEGLFKIVNSNGKETIASVYNAAGALVDEFNFSTEVEKNYNNFQSGVYYVKLVSEGNQVIKKLILF